MTGDTCNLLDFQDAARRREFPLRNRLRRDPELPAESNGTVRQFDGVLEGLLAHEAEHKHNLHFGASHTFIAELKAPLTVQRMDTVFGTELRKARKAAGLTLQQVADRLRVSYPAVQQWETGKTFPSTENLLRLRSLLGEGVWPDPWTDPPGMQLDPPSKSEVISEGRVSLPYPTNVRDVEELGLTMGGDGEDDSVFEFNGQVIDRVMRPQGLLNRKNVFALRVANSSMSPRFEEGDRIYVERMDAPAIGDYVVIELKPAEDGRPGKSFIKRLVKREAGILTVEQFNPAGYLEFGRREVLRMFRVFTQRELLGE